MASRICGSVIPLGADLLMALRYLLAFNRRAPFIRRKLQVVKSFVAYAITNATRRSVVKLWATIVSCGIRSTFRKSRHGLTIARTVAVSNVVLDIDEQHVPKKRHYLA